MGCIVMPEFRIAVLLRADDQPIQLCCYFGSGLFSFAEHVANAANLGTHAAQLFFDPLIAAIDVIDAINDGFTLRYECR